MTLKSRPEDDTRAIWRFLDRFRSESDFNALLNVLTKGVLIKYTLFDKTNTQLVKQLSKKPLNSLQRLFEIEIPEFSNNALVQLSLFDNNANYPKDIELFLTERLSKLNFNNPDSVKEFRVFYEQCLEYGIEKSGRYGDATTSTVYLAILQMSLLRFKPGTLVYDPCFGLGESLLWATQVSSQSKLTTRLVGRERNIDTYFRAVARVILAGGNTEFLSIGSCYDDAWSNELQHTTAGGAAFIVANPPFNEMSHSVITSESGIRTKHADIIILDHILSNLATNGRAAIVLPNSSLMRDGQHKFLRKRILSEYFVEAVIELPKGVFRFTTIPGNLLIVSRRQPKEDVLFVSSRLSEQLLANGPDSKVSQALVNLLESRSGNEEAARANIDLFKSSFAIEVNASKRPSFSQDVADLGELCCLDNSFLAFSEFEKKTVLEQENFRQKVGKYSKLAWLTSIRKIEELGYDLSVRPQEAKLALEDFNQNALRIRKDARLVSLEQIADCFTGVTYRSNELEAAPRERSVNGDQVLVIKGQNISESLQKKQSVGTLKPSSTIVAKEHTFKIPQKQYLKAGDILIGAIGRGKIAIVPEGFQRSIATNTVLVIRPEQPEYLSQYLALLLSSELYRDWIQDHASSIGAMSRINSRLIRSLQIVIPSIADCERLLLSLNGGEDAARLLSHWYSLEKRNDWQELALRVFPEIKSSDPLAKIAPAAHMWNQIEQWLQWVDVIIKGDARFVTPVKDWVEEWSLVCNELLMSRGITCGLNRVIMLQSLRHRIDTNPAKLALEAYCHDPSRNDSGLLLDCASRLAEIVAELIAVEVRSITDTTTIIASVDPPILQTGSSETITLEVSNEGAFYLRNFQMDILPSDLRISEAIFAPGQKLNCSVNVDTSKSGGKEFRIFWNARSLEGKSIDGVFEIPLEVVDSPCNEDFGASPYVIGNPVGANMFFGRKDVLEKVERRLRRGSSGVVLLEGNRRVGKTSILKHLDESDLLDGFVTAYWTMQAAKGSKDAGGITDEQFFYRIARILILSLYKAQKNFAVPVIGDVSQGLSLASLYTVLDQEFKSAFTHDQAFDLLDQCIESIFATLPNLNLVLMIDEFDKLHEGIENGVTSGFVPENLRSFIHKYSRLSVIIAGTTKLKRLREDYWSALFGLGTKISVEGLDTDSALNLVTKPVEGKLAFGANAQKIVALCGNHPFLIQKFCDDVFQVCAEQNKRSVTAPVMEAATTVFIETDEHFRFLWDFMENNFKRYLTIIVDELSQERTLVTMRLIDEKLKSEGVSVPIGKLGSELEALCDLGILSLKKEQGSKVYSLVVPLFGQWVSLNRDSAGYKADAIVELAEWQEKNE